MLSLAILARNMFYLMMAITYIWLRLKDVLLGGPCSVVGVCDMSQRNNFSNQQITYRTPMNACRMMRCKAEAPNLVRNDPICRNDPIYLDFQETAELAYCTMCQCPGWLHPTQHIVSQY